MADVQMQADCFEQSEAVGYRNTICLIKAIEKSVLGYNVYHLEDVFQDQHYVAAKHELTKVTTMIDVPQEFDNEDMGDMDESANGAPMDQSTILVSSTCSASGQPETVYVNGDGAVPAATNSPQKSTEGHVDNRFKSMTEGEIDELVLGRTSKYTNEQTKWGVKIFRGNYQ